MTRKTKFEDAFWGGDFCSPAGFDAVVRRMKDSRQACREFEQFIKNRAKVEEEYSKGLTKVARSAGAGTESGTLKVAWDCLRAETEKIAAEHQEASRAMNEAAARLTDFMEKQKAKRRQAEESVNDAFKKKVSFFKKTADTKKMYENKCRELEQAELQLRVSKQAGMNTMNSKDWEKMYSRQQKLKIETKKSDDSYRNNVSSLESARLHWEKEMTLACRIMEQLEDDRIVFSRNEMWVHTNILSKTWVDDDEHSEAVRLSLEKCDVDKDITRFITEKSTGTERPAPIQYEPWNQVPVPMPGGGGGTPQADRRGPGASPARPPQPLPAGDSAARAHERRAHTPDTAGVYSDVGMATGRR